MERKRLTVLRREGIINGGRSRQGQDVMNISVTMKSLVRSSVYSDDQFDYKCVFKECFYTFKKVFYLKNCFNFFKASYIFMSPLISLTFLNHTKV